MRLALISIAPFFLAVLVPTVHERLPRLPLAWIVSTLTGFLFVYLASFLPTVTEMGVIQASLPWVPDLGLTVSLYLDGLSLLFALIIVGIGAVVVLYAGYYFEETSELTRFYICLLYTSPSPRD